MIPETLLNIGECMAELQPAKDGLYGLAYGSDTLNMAWHVRALTHPLPDLGQPCWHVWSYSLKPHTIPKTRIDKMAASLIRAYGYEAAEMAFIEEDTAWRHGKIFEQGLWRQVRQRVEKLQNISSTPKISDPCIPEDVSDHVGGALPSA